MHQFLQLMSPEHSVQGSGVDSSVCSNEGHPVLENHSSSSDSGRCTDQEPACSQRRVLFDAANNSFRTLTPANQSHAIHYKDSNLQEAVDVWTHPHFSSPTYPSLPHLSSLSSPSYPLFPSYPSLPPFA